MSRSREYYSVSMRDEPEAAERLEEATGFVRDTMAMFRRRGHKSEHAVPEVAKVLGISPALTRRLHYRDSVWSIAAAEVDRIAVRFAAHLGREIAHSLEYIEQLRARKTLLEERLGAKCNKVNDGADYSGSGDGFSSVTSGRQSAA